MTPAFEVHFDGPDLPRGNLRDLLARRIAETPAGGRIDWVTYYFRDRKLAEALLAARRRGVEVRLTLGTRPRIADANDAVLRLLQGKGGLDEGLRLVSLPGLPTLGGKSWRPQIHEKLYAFSHPHPLAFIGSYNPAGDQPEERPDIVREIGDHNRSHNLLVGVHAPALTEVLIGHAQRLHGKPPGLLHRFAAGAADFEAAGTTLCFWPRLGRHPLMAFLRQFGAGARIRIAASHLRAKAGIRALAALVGRGADVEVIGEATQRRVPQRTERRLAACGVRFRRLNCPQGVLMHLKFVLAEAGGARWAVVGSFNWTYPSFWLNHEIAAISDDPGLFQALDERWRGLQSGCDQDE